MSPSDPQGATIPIPYRKTDPMRTEEELGSLYGPIRLRNSMGCRFARQLYKSGLITIDGRVAPQLYQHIQETLYVPAVETLNLTVSSGDMPTEAVGGFLAKLFSLDNWIPLFAQYELAGRQIFDLHDRLTEMLLATDLGEATLHDLHLPYDAIYIRFGPQNNIKLPFGDDGFEYFDGAFVARSPWDDAGESRIKIGFTTVHVDGTGVDYPGYFFDILPDEQNLPVPAAIEVAMCRRMEAHRDNPDDPPNTRALNSHMREYVEESATMLRAAAALLVNALFYLESIREFPAETPGRDTPPDRVSKWLLSPLAKRNKLRSSLTADGYALVRLVGTEVADDLQTSPMPHHTVRVHWRRGHWRQQHHGKLNSLTKRVWIKPVLVGKDQHRENETIPGHLYVPGSTKRIE